MCSWFNSVITIVCGCRRESIACLCNPATVLRSTTSINSKVHALPVDVSHNEILVIEQIKYFEVLIASLLFMHLKQRSRLVPYLLCPTRKNRLHPAGPDEYGIQYPHGTHHWLLYLKIQDRVKVGPVKVIPNRCVENRTCNNQQ